MNDQQKNDANKSSSTTGASSQNKGTGSDTLSAAKISAGTSVGNAGQPPMPGSGAGSSGAGSSGGMGSAGAGSSGGMDGSSAQSSTLASHTSKPMGGTGGTGASNQAHSGSAGGQGRSQGGQSAQGGQSGGQGGMTDQAKQMAGDAQKQAGEMYNQAAEVAGDVYERASEMAGDVYERASGWMSDTFQGSGRAVGGRTGGVQRYVAENPVMVGLVGLAAGLLIGALLPRTRREDEAFGEWADEVREQGMRYAHEMAQRSREFVEESFSGDDPRFAQHDSEFRPGGPSSPGSNRH